MENSPEPQWADSRAQERAAFEQKIDENPWDPNHHLVYSDWLREQGHEDEADFRKAMGEWHTDNKGAYLNHDDLPEVVRPFYGHTIPLDMASLPSGINEVPHTYSNVSDYHFAPYHVGRVIRVTNRIGWPSYRDMEEGLRKAFLANKKRGS